MGDCTYCEREATGAKCIFPGSATEPEEWEPVCPDHGGEPEGGWPEPDYDDREEVEPEDSYDW